MRGIVVCWVVIGLSLAWGALGYGRRSWSISVNRAAVLSIGTELTRGELVNRNAAWLSERLTALGLNVVGHQVVDDDLARIVGALHRLSGEVDLIVATGGLGPTTDDMTTEAVAQALGVELHHHSGVLERIEARWRERGRTMPASNRKQADFPQGATLLTNRVGTAPGFLVELPRSSGEGVCSAVFLPGVPREMKPMFEQQAVPLLGHLFSGEGHQEHLRTFGMTESLMQDRLNGVEAMFEGVVLGYRATFPEIEVKVLARGEGANDRVQGAVEEVRRRLGGFVYGGRQDTYSAVVGKALLVRGWTLGLAESCTGGGIGRMVTAAPGSSSYFSMGVVTYSYESKEAVLGVPRSVLDGFGAVSAETAEAMAQGALRIAGSDVAISVTGIAGPGGATDEKPVGTVWFGIAQAGKDARSVCYRFPGDRERVRTLTAYVALRLVHLLATDRDLEEAVAW